MADSKFGKKLKELRKERNISLRKLAKMLDLTPAYISRIENGHENPPTAEYISEIARILKIDGSILFELVPRTLRHKRIPDEIVEGYQKNKVTTKKVPEFFRTIKNSDLTEDEWDEIIKSIKDKRKE